MLNTISWRKMILNGIGAIVTAAAPQLIAATINYWTTNGSVSYSILSNADETYAFVSVDNKTKKLTDVALWINDGDFKIVSTNGVASASISKQEYRNGTELNLKDIPSNKVSNLVLKYSSHVNTYFHPDITVATQSGSFDVIDMSKTGAKIDFSAYAINIVIYAIMAFAAVTLMEMSLQKHRMAFAQIEKSFDEKRNAIFETTKQQTDELKVLKNQVSRQTLYFTQVVKTYRSEVEFWRRIFEDVFLRSMDSKASAKAFIAEFCRRFQLNSPEMEKDNTIEDIVTAFVDEIRSATLDKSIRAFGGINPYPRD